MRLLSKRPLLDFGSELLQLIRQELAHLRVSASFMLLRLVFTYSDNIRAAFIVGGDRGNCDGLPEACLESVYYRRPKA